MPKLHQLLQVLHFSSMIQIHQQQQTTCSTASRARKPGGLEAEPRLQQCFNRSSRSELSSPRIAVIADCKSATCAAITFDDSVMISFFVCPNKRVNKASILAIDTSLDEAAAPATYEGGDGAAATGAGNPGSAGTAGNSTARFFCPRAAPSRSGVFPTTGQRF